MYCCVVHSFHATESCDTETCQHYHSQCQQSFNLLQLWTSVYLLYHCGLRISRPQRAGGAVELDVSGPGILSLVERFPPFGDQNYCTGIIGK